MTGQEEEDNIISQIIIILLFHTQKLHKDSPPPLQGGISQNTHTVQPVSNKK